MADITSSRNLNPRRRHRSYPRVIRRARHNSYRVKRPGDTGTRYHGPPTIRLVNLPATVMINLAVWRRVQAERPEAGEVWLGPALRQPEGAKPRRRCDRFRLPSGVHLEVPGCCRN